MGDGVPLDLLMQLHDAIEQGIGPWRAARNVNIDGDDVVDAGNDTVATIVGRGRRGSYSSELL